MIAKPSTSIGWLTRRRVVAVGLAVVVAIPIVALLIIAQIPPTWSQVGVADPNAGFLYNIQCAPDGVCMAIQNYQIQTNRDSQGTWTRAARLPGLGESGDATGVTCFDGGCLANTDAAVYLTSSMGSKWQRIWSGPASWRLTGPSCTPSGSFCMVFGNAMVAGREPEAIVTFDNPLKTERSGRKVKIYSWSGSDFRYAGFVSASCLTPTTCEGFSPSGEWRTTDGGANWQLQLLNEFGYPNGIGGDGDCASATTCVAGGDSADFAYTRNGGTSWHTVTTRWSFVKGFGTGFSVTGISCDTRSHCLASISESSDGRS